MEVETAIDAAVGALLDALGGTRSAETERPVLELVLVLFGELRGPGYVGGFADNLVCGADFGAVGVVEAGLDEADGEVGDVDADPAAVELLGDLDGGAAAAEGVEDYVAFVGTAADNPFEQTLWFLGVVSQFFGFMAQPLNIRVNAFVGAVQRSFCIGLACPDVLIWDSAAQILLILWLAFAVARDVNHTCTIQVLELLLRRPL